MFDVRVLQQSQGAAESEGLTIIIDVFRAFTTACCFVAQGAQKIIPLAKAERAYELRQREPDFFFAGERNGEKLPGADFGNSPSEAMLLDLEGRTIIFTTSAGTQGFHVATDASELLTGSFCNAGAIVRYIQWQQPECVSLVCMGHLNERPSDEDTLCAEYIARTLGGGHMSKDEIRMRLRASPDAAKFFNPSVGWALEADFDICIDVDRFDFVLRYDAHTDLPVLRPLSIRGL